MPSRLSTNCIATIFPWTTQNFTDETRKISPEFYICGFPWKLEIRKVHVLYPTKEHLLRIYFHRLNSYNEEITCLISAEINLISFDENITSHRKVLAATQFGAQNASVIGLTLVSVEVLNDVDKKYIWNDTMVLDVMMKVDPQKRVFPSVWLDCKFSRILNFASHSIWR